MTPKLQGALQALEMLKHDADNDADEIVARVADLQTRRKAAKNKTHGALDKTANSLGDIEEFVSALEGSNGGPPLQESADSSASSGQTSEPEKLTTNGVSVG